MSLNPLKTRIVRHNNSSRPVLARRSYALLAELGRPTTPGSRHEHSRGLVIGGVEAVLEHTLPTSAELVSRSGAMTKRAPPGK